MNAIAINDLCLRNRESNAELYWQGTIAPAFKPKEFSAVIQKIHEPIHIVREESCNLIGIAFGGEITPQHAHNATGSYQLVATLPAICPERLGEKSFCKTHGVRYPYVAGEMANGIATTRLVIEMANADMLGFFGAGGLSLQRIEKAIDEFESVLGNRKPWGINLIHSPNEPRLEQNMVDVCIRRGVLRVCASAFMAITPSIVRYAASGLTIDSAGAIHRKHHLFAKLSRPEVARQFLSPAPAEILEKLVASGLLSTQEASLAARVPIAEDITVEADSGGHTDNRALVTLLPLVLDLRDQIAAKHEYLRPIRIGAAGGIGTPSAVAAAFALGAAYVVTGSINQSAVEAGISDDAKRLLAKAQLTDVMMAPAADMFELGVKLQVLKLGTMFGIRAQKLYEIYSQHASLDTISADLKSRLEKDFFRAPLEQIWEETKKFWESRDANEARRAENDPKYRMALVFRWYLGKATRWAIDGEPSRRIDYQIWCGPAMGAFNAWAAGSFLAEPENRTAVQIARNLLEGAAVVTRAQQLRSFGVPVPETAFQFRPRMIGK